MGLMEFSQSPMAKQTLASSLFPVNSTGRLFWSVVRVDYMALLKMSADIRYTEDRNGAVQLKSHLPTAPSGYRL